jgi:hypothetical protein
MPISVDGMLIVATTALIDGGRRWSAWMAFLTGVAASITANVLAASESMIARCISAWPAIALLLVVEVRARGGEAAAADTGTSRRLAQRTSPRTSERTSTRTPAADKVAAALAQQPHATVSELARLTGGSARHIRPINGAALATVEH